MPTYQYACTDCGHAFDQAQSFHEDSLTVCPSCQGRLRKVFNAVGVVFKGSGFYRTDSRSNAAAGASSTPSSSSSNDSTPGSGTTGSTAGSERSGGSGGSKDSSSTSTSPSSTVTTAGAA